MNHQISPSFVFLYFEKWSPCNIIFLSLKSALFIQYDPVLNIKAESLTH